LKDPLDRSEDLVSRRDEELLRLAWDTVAPGHRELVLTDDTDEFIAAIMAYTPVDPRWIPPPRVELGACCARRPASKRWREGATRSASTCVGVRHAHLPVRLGSAVSRAGLDTAFAAARPPSCFFSVNHISSDLREAGNDGFIKATSWVVNIIWAPAEFMSGFLNISTSAAAR
jgi:hypothetical protein